MFSFLLWTPRNGFLMVRQVCPGLIFFFLPLPLTAGKEWSYCRREVDGPFPAVRVEREENKRAVSSLQDVGEDPRSRSYQCVFKSEDKTVSQHLEVVSDGG